MQVVDGGRNAGAAECQHRRPVRSSPAVRSRSVLQTPVTASLKNTRRVTYRRTDRQMDTRRQQIPQQPMCARVKSQFGAPGLGLTYLYGQCVRSTGTMQRAKC